ncbi:SHOCT domain-containing protein [Pseudonocardia acaciae]|uniref:SHOCT domain-containing protein n=1 Tax=Pseudonocardia acaciae TaxID=551276 RepID=UPI001B80936A|nr:SHOCT domain-containing protein [Pseudonocardia acaciae]
MVESRPLVGVRAEVTDRRLSWDGHSAGTEGFLTISGPGFEWPVKFATIVRSSRKAREFAARVNSTSPPTSAGAPGPNIAPELSKLAELHRSGVLNETEFAAAKARLLG